MKKANGRKTLENGEDEKSQVEILYEINSEKKVGNNHNKIK